MAEIRNSEGYIDLTAYEAHRKIEIEERMNSNMAILKGDIYYIEKYQTYGSEQQSARPAIIVSNNKCNESSSVVEVVYLTTAPKTDLPTHVTIRSTGRNSVALCEQIASVSVDRIGNYIATVSDEEMMNIDIALMVSLGISTPKAKTVTKEVVKEIPVCGAELEKIKAELAEAKDLVDFITEERDAAIENAALLEKSKVQVETDILSLKAKLELMRELYNDALKGAAANV